LIKIMTFIISNYEKQDYKNKMTGWIEDFKILVCQSLSKKMKKSNIELLDLNIRNCFDKLKIVTLNYDRCFEHHFCLDFLKIMKSNLNMHYSKLSALQTLTLITNHPHGAIGNLYFNNSEALKVTINSITFRNRDRQNNFNYGDSEAVLNHMSQYDFTSIAVVDETDKNIGTYMNLMLSYNTKNLIILGISNLGLDNFKADLPVDANYYLFGGDGISPQNEKIPIGSNFYNSKDDNNGFASDFVEWLKEEVDDTKLKIKT
jgi:hypothetical protein